MLTEEQNQKRKINNRCNISDEINDRKKKGAKPRDTY